MSPLDLIAVTQQRAEDMVHRFGSHSASDLDAARAIASAAVEVYGMDEGADLDRIRAGQIWNDHVAVQAALAAIRLARADLLVLRDAEWRNLLQRSLLPNKSRHFYIKPRDIDLSLSPVVDKP